MLFEEKRLGVDVLDAIVVVGCLGDHVDLPRRGALLVPGLRPRAGQEDAGQLQEAAPERVRQAAPVRLALSRRRRGPGLARPARRPATSSSSTPARSCRSTGIIAEGMAMIDQHALTGESTPAEKGVGDRVFASTADGRRQDPRLGREIGQRDGLGQDQPDPQRHGRLQAQLAAQGRAAGRQGRDPDPDHRRGRAWRRWAPSARSPCSTATSAPASAWPPRWPCSARWPCAPARGSWSRTAGLWS